MAPSGQSLALLVMASFASIPVDTATIAVTPVEKVIQMLTDMKFQGSKELAIEKKAFQDFSKFATLRREELDREVASAKAKVDKLTAFIEKADSDVAEFARRIAKLDGETAKLEAEQKSATELRDGERAEFLADQTDYTESLYALDRAIQVLQAQSADRPQAEVLLQKMVTTFPGMRRVLAQLALLQENQPSGAPAVAAYEFQSGGIVELLKKMRLRFKKELGDLEKEEANKAHAYALAVLHLGNTIEQLKAERDQLAETKARVASESAAAKGELADTKESLAEAEKFLSDLAAHTASKTATFEANQKLRAEELEALQQAITIISSPEVADSYAARLSLQQASAGAALLQVGSRTRRVAARGRAIAFLQGRARALASKTLGSLVAQLAENPFSKVIEMIETLLERLKEEAASEAEHKEFCDEELRKNKLKRDEKTAKVAQLEAQIAEKDSQVEEMAKDIVTLAEQQAALTAALKEATTQRAAEKEENLAAIKDAQAGQEAVKQAILILQKFYAKAGGFLQVGARQIPDFGIREYKGIQGKDGGVIGMLQVIESDFARLEADTAAAEETASEAYESFARDTKADVESKHKAEFKLSLKKDQAEFEREMLQKDLDATKAQLATANAYYEELKPQCIVVHVSYAERSKRRAEEIAALQQAYRILNGETA